ncbi:MAG: outer membrane protein assembly factor BamA [Candidatus Aminicenantes bacterium]|nr:outer membrane protein assembly factor BamA [Candidatus Aminicenantes bacterium]
MSRYIKGFRKRFFPFCLVVGLSGGFPSLFQAPFCSASPQASSATISEVVFWVDGRPGPENMQELISINPGSVYSLKKVNDAIKQIYKTGMFSDIQVRREGREAIRLVFHLKRKFVIQSVSATSDLKIPDKELVKSIFSLQKGEAFSPERLEKAVKELESALRLRGFFSPEYSIELEKNEEDAEINVFFKVNSFKRYRIKSISFKGEPLFPHKSLEKHLESKPGKDYVPSRLLEDVERLQEYYRSQNFRRAEVAVGEEIFDKEQETVNVSLIVKPHEKIELETKGAKIPEDLLKPIWEERIFEEWGVSEGEAKIKVYLRNKGYIFPQVRSSIERGENTIRILYHINPGKKYKVEHLIFKGNESFSREELMSTLDIPQKIPFLSWIDEARIFELPREIKAYYGMQGFPNTDVDLTFIMHENSIDASYTIMEGPRETIESLSFEGHSYFTRENLLKTIESREGGPFFSPDVQRDVETLENLYLNKGVRGTRIFAEVKKVKEYAYSVAFVIQEGRLVTIEKILVAGNKTTREGTIFKEIRVKEGEYARYSLLQESKRRLERLGIFTDVKIEEIPLDVERENIVVRVREGERNYASLGIGLETKEEPKSFAVWNTVVRPRGTAELMRNNVFGTAAQLSLVGQISLREKRAVISWEQPYFFGLPFQTYLNGWLEQETRKSYSYDRRGVSLTAIKSFSEETLLLSTLRLAQTKLFDLQFSPSEIDRQFFPFSTTSISESFIWDKRNDPFNPARGHFFSIAFEWAYPLFNSESDFQKLFSKYQQFFTLFDRVVISATARVGLGRGRIPIHERFFAGGSNSFRGTEFDELGPKDPDSLQPIGGKALTLLNFELSFPLLSALKDLFGTVFYDVGSVFSKRSQFNLKEMQNALGFGLRYRTPLGPVRLEMAWNLDVPQGEKKIFAFFTIGHVF